MAENKNPNTAIATVCDICGLPKKNPHAGTITGWIFGGARCKCFSPDIASGATANETNFGIKNQLVQKNLNETFDVLEILGRGGMGTVYRVHEKTGGKRELALKLLRPELSNDPVAVRRFQHEILAAKELVHPNLVRIFDCGVSHERNPYFVMELIEGESLTTLLQREGSLDAERTIAILSQVCSALQHAHDRNIIHRDLKPSNILLMPDPDGSEIVKLVDFGVAKILPAPGKDTFTITKTGEIFGSPTYMSPEQCQGETVDSRSDIYALGCVMYECLTGHPPMFSENPVKTLLAHIYDQPPPMQLQNVSKNMASKLDLIVGTCLEKQPDKRYESVKALADDLQLVYSDREPRVVKDARAREASINFKRNIRMHTAWALPVVVIATAVLAIWYTGTNLYAMSRFISAVEKEPKDYFNPVYKDQSGIDRYDIPFCYQFIGEYAGAHNQPDKAIEIFSVESNMLIRRGDKDSAAAPNVFIEQYEGWRGHKKAARVAALNAANLILASSRETSKGMRFGKWFYIILYPASLEMYKAPQRLDENYDIAEGERLCNLFSESILRKADKYPSLVNACTVTNAIHYYYLGNTTLGKKFYNATIDQVGGVPDEPLGPVSLFISDKLGMSTDILQMYFGDRRCAPELLNRYFADCAVTAGDLRTARILFRNLAREYRSIGLAACEALGGARNTDALFDRAISDRLSLSDWTEDDLIDRLYMAHKYSDIDVIYSGLISAAKRRGPAAAGLAFKFDTKYCMLLSAQNKLEQSNKIRADLIQTIDQIGYSPVVHSTLRSIADKLAEDMHLPEALSTYELMLSKDSTRADTREFIPYDKLEIACVTALQGDYVKANTIYGEMLNSSHDQIANTCAWMAKANIAMAQKNLPEALQDISNLKSVDLATGSISNENFNSTPWTDCNLYLRDRCAEIMWNGNKLTNVQQFLLDSLAYYPHATSLLQTHHCDLASAMDGRLANNAERVRYLHQSRELRDQTTVREIFETLQMNRKWRVYTGDVSFALADKARATRK